MFNTLAEWTALDDAALDEKIRLSTGKTPMPAQRARPRRLFATALETPGGLKVQTIHAFCTRLLHQFPFEANVAARFEVLDEAATSQLLNELTLDVDVEGRRRSDGALGRALATAITAAADITFKEVIAETISKRDLVTQWVDARRRRAAGDRRIDPQLRARARTTACQAVEHEYFSASLIAQSRMAGADRVFWHQRQGANRQANAPRLEQRLRDRRPRTHRALSRCVLHRRARGPRKHPDQATSPRPIRMGCSDSTPSKDRVCALVAREFALRARDRSAALLTVAAAVIERYRAEKDRRGLLDYEDLIDKTLALFRKRPSAAWVLYKLDLGIDHVLVDEAQDTSPKQWEIIATLVAEFVPGGARGEREAHGVRGRRREAVDLFVPGRGAARFADNARPFRRAVRSRRTGLRDGKTATIRSAPRADVLAAVDSGIQAARRHFAGFTGDDVGRCIRRCPMPRPGEVEIWELIAPDEKDAGKEGWDAPFDTTSETSPAIKLAAQDRAHGESLVRARHAAARRAHSGAPARPAVRGGDPRAQARGASLSPAPTGSC